MKYTLGSIFCKPGNEPNLNPNLTKYPNLAWGIYRTPNIFSARCKIQKLPNFSESFNSTAKLNKFQNQGSISSTFYAQLIRT
jgi:hypothetical protein